ncbi:MAG: cyclic nucleotide-binding domain-containing protein, partial [Planctomycetota bacterium]
MEATNQASVRADLLEIRATLASSPALGQLDAHDLDLLVEEFDRITVEGGTTIVCEGAKDRSLYVIIKGEARVLRSGVELVALRAGDLFGELALVTGEARAARVETTTPAVLARLTHKAYVRF